MGFGFRVWDLGCGVWGREFGVWDSGFGVERLGRGRLVATGPHRPLKETVLACRFLGQNRRNPSVVSQESESKNDRSERGVRDGGGRWSQPGRAAGGEAGVP